MIYWDYKNPEKKLITFILYLSYACLQKHLPKVDEEWIYELLTFPSAEEIHIWPLTLRLLGIRSTLSNKNRTNTSKQERVPASTICQW